MKGTIEIFFLCAFDAFAASSCSQCLLQLLDNILPLAARDRAVLKPMGLWAGIGQDASLCSLKCFALPCAGSTVLFPFLCLSLPGIQALPWPRCLLCEPGGLGWVSVWEQERCR